MKPTPHRRSSHRAASLAADLHTSRRLMWMTALTLGCFLAWAHWAEIDEVTRAPGSVIASSRTQLIQSQEGGALESVLVREGDIVEAQQILARIEKTRAETAYLETRAKAASLTATMARLQAEVFGGTPNFSAALRTDYPDLVANQRMLLRKRQAALQEEAQAINTMVQLVQQELDMNLPLVASGDVSKTEILRLQRQIADMKSQITNKRNKYFQDAQAELSKVQEDLLGVEQSLAQRHDVLAQTELRAPVRGVVKNVRITTQGGVIRPGEEVMQIVPLEDDLLIEAKLRPADIAFIKPGLDARVKIDAYDYTIYGDLPGKLDFISADTLTEDLRQGEAPYYRMRVRTTGRQFSGRPDATLEILPGMTATVEIMTGRKTVLQYIAKPIVKTLNESMAER
ncbi:HlyD family type I secretion periplasmic adaptor subunit [Hydrogenophaga sp.]|uniref:HlyD family type I secretion periplasmic adaptor subunit n=1 Tax=Hydrogenophaga sp. TaxID=1904254 RepID=UPI00286D9611|nr:HlyD family type I secretion periplasmic adaptor subunit [Hydrogenophaga sp.]